MTKWTTRAAQNPNWQSAGMIHDWRNWISEEVRTLWTTFTVGQREALIRQAQAFADSEEWD